MNTKQLMTAKKLLQEKGAFSEKNPLVLDTYLEDQGVVREHYKRMGIEVKFLSNESRFGGLGIKAMHEDEGLTNE